MILKYASCSTLRDLQGGHGHGHHGHGGHGHGHGDGLFGPEFRGHVSTTFVIPGVPALVDGGMCLQWVSGAVM